jgi:hypothetical protein
MGLTDAEMRYALALFDGFEDRSEFGGRIEAVVLGAVRCALTEMRTVEEEVEGVGTVERPADCRPESAFSVGAFSEPFEEYRDSWNVDPDASQRAYNAIADCAEQIDPARFM